MIHPVYTMPFSHLWAGLFAHLDEGLVHRDIDGDLSIFNYAKACTYKGAWNPITMVARGLVLDTAANQIVALGFPKFFNLGERSVTPPDEPFVAWEKLDGSMGVVFFYGGRWRCATRGSFRSPQALTGQRMLDGLDTRALRRDCSYLVEILSPDHRVVVPYEKEQLVLLGAYEVEPGKEVPPETLDRVAAAVGMGRPRRLPPTTLPELMAHVASLPMHQEGYVLHFESGLRVKLKGDAYLAAHRTIEGVRPLTLWEQLRSGADLAPLRETVPEEFRADFDAITNLLLAAFASVLRDVGRMAAPLKKMERREVAVRVVPTLPPGYGKPLFAWLDGDCTKLHEAVWDLVRPHRNELKGYTPSSAMNRVAEASS